MTRIKGVDISYCQERIDFAELQKADVKFAIIRAGFSTKKDVTMDKFIADCKAYNIPYGFYWYSYAMSMILMGIFVLRIILQKHRKQLKRRLTSLLVKLLTVSGGTVTNARNA